MEVKNKMKKHSLWEALGVELPKELSEISNKKRRLAILEKLEESGVIIVNPENTYIESTVRIERGTVIMPDTFIFGNSWIKQEVIMGPLTVIVNSVIGKRTKVRSFSHIANSVIGDNCKIGPFADIKDNSKIDDEAEIGMAQIVRSEIGEKTTAKHKCYIGDTKIGKRCNIGAGFNEPEMIVTCNYDGKEKHQTEIGDDVFIGSGVMLVAPVKIGDKAFIAANSTVTEDVPPGKALGNFVIARPQENKPNRVKVAEKKNGKNIWTILKSRKAKKSRKQKVNLRYVLVQSPAVGLPGNPLINLGVILQGHGVILCKFSQSEVIYKYIRRVLAKDVFEKLEEKYKFFLNQRTVEFPQKRRQPKQILSSQHRLFLDRLRAFNNDRLVYSRPRNITVEFSGAGYNSREILERIFQEKIVYQKISLPNKTIVINLSLEK